MSIVYVYSSGYSFSRGTQICCTYLFILQKHYREYIRWHSFLFSKSAISSVFLSWSLCHQLPNTSTALIIDVNWIFNGIVISIALRPLQDAWHTHGCIVSSILPTKQSPLITVSLVNYLFWNFAIAFYLSKINFLSF